MLEEIYHFANALWPLWGMILFLGIVAYVAWPGNKSKLESYGEIPLDDDKPKCLSDRTD